MPGLRTLIESMIAHIRLNRRGLIGAAIDADVAVRVHQAGHDDFAGEIPHFGAGRNCDVGGPDRGDFSILHHEHAVFNRGAADRDDRCAFECERLFLSVGAHPEEKRGYLKETQHQPRRRDSRRSENHIGAECIRSDQKKRGC